MPAEHDLIKSASIEEPTFHPRRRPARMSSQPFAPAPQVLKVALVSPRFNPSYFGYDYLLPLLPGDKRVQMVGGALPLLAALVGTTHQVVIFDESLEPINFEELKQFDVIGLTGMIVQRQRMHEILKELSDYAGIIAVGGPYA